MDEKDWAPQTKAAQALGWTDATTGAVVEPIHPSTTYLRDPDNLYRRGRQYARADNPGFDQPQALISALEQGAEGLIFSSGMAAATSCFMALRPGDHVIAPDVMYWSLRAWLTTYAKEWGLVVDSVDMRSPEAVARALKPGHTRLVWIETPANPLWTVTDIAAVAELAHRAGAHVVVDSTCATPVLTRPLMLGADIVMHSASKYLNGHSDVIAGALVTRTCDEYWQRIRALRVKLGSIPGPFEAYLLTRGMRTLYVRVHTASANALKIAMAMQRNPAVDEVLYPGLADRPDHALAARQMQGGFGGMLSLRIRGGEAAAVRVAARVRLWKRATSLGGVESLIEHRGSVEGADSPCPMDLLRLSVGIEAVEDLIADLEQALAES
ncbi:MAG: aminotransferase class V-fold PLP-dependent enzyme [Alphaproteobacteria bacterium]|nr:aminotransferase class V-fold PLP-dependent enzyme [Alphaproteobacteria bacterium]